MTPERLQELLNAFVDDQLDAQGQRELATALETDEEARRAFVRTTDQHQALRELLGRAAAKPRHRALWIPLAAAAAAAVLALLFFLLRSDAPGTGNTGVAVRERKTVPAPKPTLPVPIPIPTPPPDPKPAPDPLRPPPQPTPPLPPPKEPEKPPTPLPPEPKPPVVPPAKPPEPPPPPKETAIAIGTLESARGEVFALVGGERRPIAAGQVLSSGPGLETGAGDSSAVLVFSDATRLELRPGTLLTEISATAGKKVVLGRGSLLADVAKQPAGQPMIFSTPHAEAMIQGTKLALHCGEATKLELKEGKARFTRSEDKRSVDLVAGQSSIAGKGQDLAPKRITRGPMMAGVIWGEDFQDPAEIEKDWSLSKTGLLVTTHNQLEFDPTPGGTASLGTRASFAAPFRVSVDVEFTQRLKGTLLALRLQSWKLGKEFIHLDLDEERYYLMVPDQTVTADLPRKNPHRERWTLEVAADGSITVLVDSKAILKSRRPPGEEFHLNLLVKAGKDVPPGARVRFDTLVVERMK